jgi:hypothetical protein
MVWSKAPGVAEREHLDVALENFSVAELHEGNVGGLMRHMGHVREMREVGAWGGWVVEHVRVRVNAVIAGDFVVAVAVVVVVVVEIAITTSTDTVATLESYIAPNNVEEPRKSLGKTCECQW